MTPSDSEKSLVTKNALVSVAADWSSSVIPAPSSRSAPWLGELGAVAGGERLGLRAVLRALRKLTMPPTYSGTTSMLSGKVAM